MCLLKHVSAFCTRFHISFDDVFRAVNNTAMPAIRTGLYVAQDRVAQGKKPTTCMLHAQELVLKHGLGLVARVLPDKTKDTFKEGVKLKAKVKALASKVMDKKAKGRYQDYVRVANLISPCTPNKLALPNSTCVSGVFLLFTSVLRAR